MRPGDYLSYALRDIRRQPLRSLLTVVALAISACVLVVMVAISLGGQKVIYNQFGAGDALATITVTANSSGGGLSPFGEVQRSGEDKTVLSDETVKQLATLLHVQLAVPRAHVWEVKELSSGSSVRYVAQVEGTPSDAYLTLSAGSSFSSNSQTGVVVLGHGYAASLGLSPQNAVGRTITFTTHGGYRGAGATIPLAGATRQQLDAFNASPTTIQAKIIGVTEPGPNQNFAFVPLDWARKLRTVHFYEGDTLKTTDQLQKDGYTTIQVKVDSTANVKEVSDAIGALGYGRTSLLDTAQQLNQLVTTVGIILGAVAIIAMLAAMLGVVNTMVMAVSEQRLEIGIWRACGARRATVVGLFLMEAALLGVIGGALGVAASIPIAGFVTSYGSSLLTAQGLAAVPLTTITPTLAVAAVGVTMVFCLLAGLYPAYRAARLDPSRIVSQG